MLPSFFFASTSCAGSTPHHPTAIGVAGVLFHKRMRRRGVCLRSFSGMVALFALPVHAPHQKGRQAWGTRPLPQLR